LTLSPSHKARAICLFCIAAVVAFLGVREPVYAQQSSLDSQSSYPHLELTKQPKLGMAYSHFLDGDYEASIAELKRFKESYPIHENIDYAYYLEAVDYFMQISGRDARSARLANAALEKFLRKFPDSRYAQDASLKARDAAEVLAADHLTIGRFYQDRDECLAAIKRFQIVLREYPGTGQVPEALHRLVECFTAMGFRDIQLETYYND
jgi:outer membrane protein assembly factor BamD